MTVLLTAGSIGRVSDSSLLSLAVKINHELSLLKFDLGTRNTTQRMLTKRRDKRKANKPQPCPLSFLPQIVPANHPTTLPTMDRWRYIVIASLVIAFQGLLMQVKVANGVAMEPLAALVFSDMSSIMDYSSSLSSTSNHHHHHHHHRRAQQQQEEYPIQQGGGEQTMSRRNNNNNKERRKQQQRLRRRAQKANMNQMKMTMFKKTEKQRKLHVPELQIPTPVFVLSLPKSGTTSLYSYFVCGGIWSAHTYGKSQEGKAVRLGKCMQRNFVANRPLLRNCAPQTKVFTDVGYLGKRNSACFYPSIQAVTNIVRDYPNATIIVSYRSAADWHDSVLKFHHLRERWRTKCDAFPNSTDPAVWQDFYLEHRRRIRQAVASHPTIRYLEFDLLDPTVGQQLQNFTGISEQCWQNCKPNFRCSHTPNRTIAAVAH